jgi:NitT/TauT family transport system permease protein
VEIAANPLGLGNAMMRAQETVQPDLMLAYLIWIGLVGWAINNGIVRIQERLFGRTERAAPPS